MKMGVDIETYSSVDLQKAGVRPYTEAPDFAILLIGYKVDDQPTRIIDLADNGDGEPTLLPPVPSDLPAGDLDEFLCLLTNPEVTKTAYNAAFERTCLPGTLSGLCPRSSGAVRWSKRPPWGCPVHWPRWGPPWVWKNRSSPRGRS